jgi:hypothetical protein
MQVHFNKINMYVDDFFYRSIAGISDSIKIGLNFNNIHSQVNSPSGSLIDYNFKVIIYNSATLGAILQIALLALGMNFVVVAICVGALLIVRQKVKKELNDFWRQRAAEFAIDTSADFALKTARIYNWTASCPPQDPLQSDFRLTAGKDCGPFGIFKTVSPMEELISAVRSEANLQDSDEEFKSKMKNLPANTGLFLSLLKVSAFLQGKRSV